MPRALFLIAIALLLGACLHNPPPVRPAQPAPRLDWSASGRWVHVDTATLESAPVFEGARHRWLAVLGRQGAFVPEGRPLFWSGLRGGVRTYWSVSPFEKFADLDVRRQIAIDALAKAGDAAVADYNTGDTALILPHTSEIWFRQPDLDFLSPVAGDLSELTATHARLEFHQMQPGGGERLEAAWKAVQEALTKERYPLTCRGFFVGFGTGFTVQIWLAPNAEALRQAPPLEAALRQALGDERGAALVRDLAELLPVKEELEIERRDDLSHLAR
jgi:hypothetical protein